MDLFSILKNKTFSKVPTFCTGWPDQTFMDTYKKKFLNKSNYSFYPPTHDYESVLQWDYHDYSLIQEMGFDGVSIWSFRKGSFQNISLPPNQHIDMWGRIYEGKWYTGKGLLSPELDISLWPRLVPIEAIKYSKFRDVLPQFYIDLYPVISLPGIFEKGWQGMGYSIFAKALRNNHSFLHLVFERIYDYLLENIKHLIEIGVKVFMFMDDVAYKHRTFLNPNTWDSFVGIHYRKLIKFLHEKNCVAIIHSDGDIFPMMPFFIDIGFDGIQGLEYLAGVNIFDLISEYGSEIVLIGGLDVSTTLSFGTPHDVQKNIEKIFAHIQKSECPFIISPSQGITPSVKPENIQQMIKQTQILNRRYCKL